MILSVSCGINSYSKLTVSSERISDLYETAILLIHRDNQEYMENNCLCTLISENLENWGCMGDTEHAHAMFTRLSFHHHPA